MLESLKRILRTYVAPLLAALLLLLAVRSLLVAQYAVPASGAGDRALLPGDRVLVDRTAYGIRRPFAKLWGYGRWGYRCPEGGDLAVFNAPLDRTRPLADREVCMARCLALPGDTLWLDLERNQVLLARTSVDAVPFVVPQAGSQVRVTPHNARLLWNTLRYHEGVACTLLNGKSLLCKGSPLESVRFSQDYYWMAGSERYGLVPHSLLIGRAFCISFSVDASQPFYRKLRPGRLFSPVR